MKRPDDNLFDFSVIPAVIEGVANTRGYDFFHSITAQLANAIGSDFTFIGRIRGNVISTLSAYENGEQIENFEYNVANGPCEKVTDAIDSTICTFTHDVASIFPDDVFLQEKSIEGYIGMPLYASNGEVLGLIVALYTRPIDDASKNTAIFEVFAGRIAAEIENTEKEHALQLLADKLQASVDELNDYKDSLEEKVELRTRELRQAKIHAENQYQSQNAYLATLAHEIRTPMNGILGMATLLQDAKLDETQQMYLDTIQRSGETLTQLINDILDFSKSDSGRMSFEKAEFHLPNFLESAVAPFRAFENKSLALKLDIADNLPKYIIGDQTRLYQVMNNLLGNAFKFTEAGSVTLKVNVKECTEKKVLMEFSVIDTGIGIAKDKQADIFEPFVQAEHSTTRMYGGTGLGLAICKRVVKLAGGNIHLSSEPGKGSTFSFTMPFEVSNTEGKKGYSLPYTNADKCPENDIKILVVDDNPVNVIVAVGLLNKMGISPDVANNGQQAIDQVCSNQSHYDVVLMDCEMPGISGYQATQTIRQWEGASNKIPTTIYAFTANNTQDERTKYEAAGMNGAVRKPVDVNELTQMLKATVM